MPEIDEKPIVENRVEVLKKEIEELEAKIKKSRNTVEKALLADQIVDKNKEINKINNPDQEKEIVTQKDAPAIMDHKSTRRTANGSIINAGSSFITSI